MRSPPGSREAAFESVVQPEKAIYGVGRLLRFYGREARNDMKHVPSACNAREAGSNGLAREESAQGRVRAPVACSWTAAHCLIFTSFAPKARSATSVSCAAWARSQ